MHIFTYRFIYLLVFLCLFLGAMKANAAKVACTEAEKKIECFTKGQKCEKDDEADVEKCEACDDGKFGNFELECTDKTHPCDQGQAGRWLCGTEKKECEKSDSDPGKHKCAANSCTKRFNFDGFCTADDHPCDKQENRWKCYATKQRCSRKQDDIKQSDCTECPPKMTLNFDGLCTNGTHPCDKEEERIKCFQDGKACQRKDNFYDGECKACDVGTANFDGRCGGNAHRCDDEAERLKCYMEGKGCQRGTNFASGVCEKCPDGQFLNFDGRCTRNAHRCDDEAERLKCYMEGKGCQRGTDFASGVCEKCPDGQFLNFDGRCTRNAHRCDDEAERLKCYMEGKGCQRGTDFASGVCEKCPDGQFLNFDGRCTRNAHRCDDEAERLKCYMEGKGCQRGTDFASGVCEKCPDGQFLNFDGRCTRNAHRCDDEAERLKCYMEGKGCQRGTDFASGVCKKCPDGQFLNFDGRCMRNAHRCDNEVERLKCYMEGKGCQRGTDFASGVCEKCPDGQFLNFDGRCTTKAHPCDDENEKWKCNAKRKVCIRDRTDFAKSNCDTCDPPNYFNFDGRCTAKAHPCDDENEKWKCNAERKVCIRDRTDFAKSNCDNRCDPPNYFNFDGRCTKSSHPCDDGREEKWKCNVKGFQCVRHNTDLKLHKCRDCPPGKPILNFDGRCSEKKHPCDDGQNGRIICNLQTQECRRKEDDFFQSVCAECKGDNPYLSFDGKCSDQKHPCDNGEIGKNECDVIGKKCIRDEDNSRLFKCGACQEGKPVINFDDRCSEQKHPCDEGEKERNACHSIESQCLRDDKNPKLHKCLPCPPDQFLNFDGKCSAQRHPCDEGQEPRKICNEIGKECRRDDKKGLNHICAPCPAEKPNLNFDGKCSAAKHLCDKGGIGQERCMETGKKCRRADSDPNMFECVNCPVGKPHLNFDGVCNEDKHPCDEGEKGRIQCNSAGEECKRDERDLKKFRCSVCPNDKVLSFDGTCSDEKHECDEGGRGKTKCDKVGDRCKKDEHNPKSYKCVPCPIDRPILNFDGICTRDKHACDEGQKGRKECTKIKNDCKRDQSDLNKYVCVACPADRPTFSKEGKCTSRQSTDSSATYVHHKCLEELSLVFQILIVSVVYFSKKLFM